MKVQTGWFKGNGDFQRITIGWKPAVVIARTATANGSMHYHCEDMWCKRTDAFHNLAAAQSGIQIRDDGFEVGSLVGVNEAGATIYWMALAPSVEDPASLETVDYMGSGAAGRVLNLKTQKAPLAALFKRDSNASGVFWESVSGWATFMDSTSQASQSAYVQSAAVGSFTLSADIRVNEYGTGNGEGTSCLAFFPGSTNLKIVQWEGNGQANRRIVTGDTRRIKALLVQVADASGGPRVKTQEMSGGLIATAKPVALPTDNIALDGSDLILPVSSGVNTTPRLYTALVWFEEAETPLTQPSKRAPAVITKGRRAVFLPGRSVPSRIDCSNSDTLKIDGSITIEMMTQAMYGAGGDTVVGNPLWLIARSAGVTGPASAPDTRGNFSFAMALVRNLGSNGGPLQGWPGPQMMTTVSSFMDLQANPVHCGYLWRTGVMPRRGQPYDHWVFTISGTGAPGAAQSCKLYRLGGMVKQRDMPVPAGLDGVKGGTGHRTVIGAQWDGASYLNPGRMSFMAARIYNRALTADEVAARYARSALQSTAYADVTSGLVEEWDAANARGATLPATVNAANNGTIVNGAVIAL